MPAIRNRERGMTVNNIKPIQTAYNGYLFRSRLEARWAVFFDTMGIRYEYEAEGYDLDGVWYLPDFWLPEQDCFVEIKPFNRSPKNLKCELLSKKLDKSVVLVAGTPHKGGYKAILYCSDEQHERFFQTFSKWFGGLPIGQKTQETLNLVDVNFLTGTILDYRFLPPAEIHNKILNAYNAASMARF